MGGIQSRSFVYYDAQNELLYANYDVGVLGDALLFKPDIITFRGYSQGQEYYNDVPYTITTVDGKVTLQYDITGNNPESVQIVSMEKNEMVWVSEWSNVHYTLGQQSYPAAKRVDKNILKRL